MNPVRHHLLALGSAAVLTVYAAGYARTRAAAERFADDDQRRPGLSEAAEPALAAQPEVATPAALPIDTQAAVIAAPTPKRVKTVTPATRADTPKVVAVLPSVDSVLPSVVAPPPPPPPPAAPVVNADSVAAEQKAHVAWKDGVYSGWGTSRHGDIEATVEIRDGKIFSATISQCLTRYPCSRIAQIVPQVVARQSADVDYVSGATQSANAFYHAVLEALTKAK